ncbi:MAG TPA: sensor N-terminal transmembrane domain-containing protein, partial [Paracoccaceae bacterium]|nr:sensor N-terminal transmembrane domain-containing protein [Paracoccaceae bacterium]
MAQKSGQSNGHMNWIAAIRKGQKSPLARRIIAFNLVGLSLLVSGILYLNQFRETASELRISQLRVEAGIFSAALGHLAEKEGVFRLEDPEIFALAEKLTAEADGVVQLFSVSGNPLGENVPLTVPVAAVDKSTNSLVDVFRDVRDKIAGLIVRRDQPVIGRSQTALYSSMAIGAVQAGAMRVSTSVNEADQVIVAAAMPVFNGSRAIGGIVLATQAGEIDAVLRKERSEILQVFALAILISIALSVLLARTIARPLEELTEAAEMGSVQKTGKLNPGRIHIPDMSARPDEIGALSRQMRA